MPEFNDAARQHLFASDEAVRRTYANGRTVEALAGADLSSFRRVAWRLSELVPRGAHGSPGWGIPHPPVIVVGRMNRVGAINIERQGFGLRAVDRHLHIFVNRELLIDLAAGRRGLTSGAGAAGLNLGRDWPWWETPQWQRRHGGALFRWYRIPVDLPDGSNPPPDHPLADGHDVARMLRAINERPGLEHPKPPTIAELLAPARQAAAAPAGVAAIYPRLIALFKEGKAPVARRAA